TNGFVPLWLRVYVAPYLAGAFASSRLHSLRQAHAHEIADGVWLGRYPSRADRRSYASFVDLTAEFPFDPHGVPYRSILNSTSWRPTRAASPSLSTPSTACAIPAPPSSSAPSAIRAAPLPSLPGFSPPAAPNHSPPRS